MLQYVSVFWKWNLVLWGLFALLGMGSVAAQKSNCTRIVKGRISNQEGQPIVGAIIAHLAAKHTVRSDKAGAFQLSNECDGSMFLHVEAVGYEHLDVKFELRRDTTLGIVLSAIGYTTKEVAIEEHAVHTQEAALSLPSFSLNRVERQLTQGASLGEKVAQLPGASNVTTGPNVYKPMIHGLTGNRVVVLSDGIRQEGQQWGFDHAPEIDGFAADRVSIITGPSSLLYGPDALAGVISTNQAPLPLTGWGGVVQLNGQSNGLGYGAHAMLQVAKPTKIGSFGFRISANTRGSQWRQTPTYALANTAFQERGYHATMGWQVARHNVQLAFSQFDVSYGVLAAAANATNLNDLRGAIERGQPNPIDLPNNYVPQRPYQDVLHQKLRLTGEHLLGDWQLKWTASWQGNLRNEFDFVPLTNRLTPDLLLRLMTHHAQVYAVSPTYAGWHTTLVAQGQYQTNEREFSPIIPNFINQQGGLGAIQHYQGHHWLFEAGLRADWVQNQTFYFHPRTAQKLSPTFKYQGLSGMLGVVLVPHADASLAINLGTAWRAPNVYELYAAGVHQGIAAFERGDSTIGIERSYQLSATYEVKVKHWQLQLAPFVSWYDNFIYSRPVLGGQQTPRGPFLAYDFVSGRLQQYGLDARVQFQPHKHWTITAKPSLLYSWNISTADYQIFMPPQRILVSIRHQFQIAIDWCKQIGRAHV